MFRKILVVLSCMIILMSCVVPCFAVGSGAYKFAPLQFDFVTSSAGNTAWLFNEFGTGGGDFSNAAYSAAYSCSSDLTNADVELYAGAKFRLFSRRQIVLVDNLAGYGFYPGLDAEHSGSVTIQFNLIRFETVRGAWKERSTMLKNSYAVRPGEFFDLGSVIKSMIRDVSQLCFVRIDNLSVDVSLIVDNTSPCLDLRIPLGLDYNNTQFYEAWYAAFGLDNVTVVEYTKASDATPMTLVRSMFSDIWNIQFFPGMKLGEVMSLIIGVLLLLWFLKVVGGK